MIDRSPSVLYKYFPVESWLRQLLLGKSLKFASRTEFNDPFDSRAGYQIEDSVAGRQYVRQKFKGINLSPAKRMMAELQAQRSALKPKLFSNVVSDELLDRVGLLCLTEQWTNPLLWAHYASKHSGLCVGFRTDRDVFFTAKAINYVGIPPIIHRPNDSNEVMVEKALLTKDECWGYEKEWRIMKVNKPRSETEKRYETWPDEHRRYMVEQRGPGFYEFDVTAIESVTMGLCISPNNEQLVRRIVSEVAHGVPLYKVRRLVDTYQLTRDLVRRPTASKCSDK